MFQRSPEFVGEKRLILYIAQIERATKSSSFYQLTTQIMRTAILKFSSQHLRKVSVVSENSRGKDSLG